MIYINEDFCKGCHLCLFMCYKNVYAISPEVNKKGAQLPFAKFEDRCTKCGVCEIVCPDQAISLDVDGNWWVEDDTYKNFNPKMTKA